MLHLEKQLFAQTKVLFALVSCSIYQSVLYVIGSGGPVTPDKVAESKALKINWGRVNGKANTLLWQLGRSGYFHPDIRSKLSFPALWPSHLRHRTPSIYRFSLSLPRLNRLTRPLNSDPGDLPSCQRCWWGGAEVSALNQSLNVNT